MTPSFAPLNWKPVRRGKIYCSSACGSSCTFDAYSEANRKGKALAVSLGKGWKHSVWENMGWHFKAVSPCKRIKVHGSNGRYIAFLGEPGRNGGRYAEHGKTPRGAVKTVIAAAKIDLARIGALFKDISC